LESHPDIRFIEAKLRERERAGELDVLKRQRLEILKERGQPSPGLLAAIARLEQRQSAFHESLELDIDEIMGDCRMRFRWSRRRPTRYSERKNVRDARPVRKSATRSQPCSTEFAAFGARTTRLMSPSVQRGGENTQPRRLRTPADENARSLAAHVTSACIEQ